jgi:hypothetical protein
MPKDRLAKIKLQSLGKPDNPRTVVKHPAPLSDPKDVTIIEISHETDKKNNPNVEARVYSLICHPNNESALPMQGESFRTKGSTAKKGGSIRFVIMRPAFFGRAWESVPL